MAVGLVLVKHCLAQVSSCQAAGCESVNCLMRRSDLGKKEIAVNCMCRGDRLAGNALAAVCN